MRSLLAIPLLLTLIAPAALAGTVTTGAAGESGVSGQSGSSLGAGSVSPISINSAGLAPSLTGSAGLTPNLSAPAANLNQGLAPSALNSALKPASAGDKKGELPAAAQTFSPPGGPPKNSPAASGGGPPVDPPFVQALRKLEVPAAEISAILKLATERGADLAARVAGLSELETPARRVLLIVSAALREADPLEASGIGDRLGARFGFDGQQLLALSNFELYANPADAFPKSDAKWVGAWVRRLTSLDSSVARAAAIRETMTSAANEDAAAINGDRAPPELARDVASAKKYVAGIMGGIKPTERQIDSLLGDWLEENGIKPGSERHLAIRAALVPGKAAADAALTATIDPALRHRAHLLLRAAERHGATVAAIEAMLRRRELWEEARTIQDSWLDRQIDIGMESEGLRELIKDYPESAAGELMRGLVSNMTARSGKSVEEVARDGVFIYADVLGQGFRGAYSSRDPDIKSSAVAFYVTRDDDGRWKVDVYRQNKNTGSSDAELVRVFKAWLVAGGIPAAHLH
jgi:hypothetical protein